MRLAHRLQLGALTVIGMLVLYMTVSVDRKLSGRLALETIDHLATAARLIGLQWQALGGAEGLSDESADSLADAAARASGYRVTLIDNTGIVVGDSEFDRRDIANLENHSDRAEVADARKSGMGTTSRRSVSAGDEELYVAISVPGERYGIARVSLSTASLNAIVRAARRDVAVSGGIALLVAVLLSWLFAKTISRPVESLSTVARSLAQGDFSRRPSLAAPGEVGDLAKAVNDLAEQLSTRLDALQREETLIYKLTESLNEGVIAIDANGNVIRANDTAKRLLDLHTSTPLTREQLPRNRELRETIASALRGVTVADRELSLGGRPCRVTAQPLDDGGIVIALLDLTELRRLETIRRDFVANVSHELKTPLTVIRGFAESLSDDDMPTEVRAKFADGMKLHAVRMQRLIDDLLDLSRMESGGWMPSPELNELPDVIASELATAESEASRKGIQFVRRWESKDPSTLVGSVFADATALRQVVANMLDNAIRYTTSGSVSIDVARHDGGIEISVSDTGPGIAAEHVERIFERFYRVDPGRSRETGGTGLGLSIVKHLVEAHGGKVSVSSTPGVGSRFSAIFPDEVS